MCRRPGNAGAAAKYAALNGCRPYADKPLLFGANDALRSDVRKVSLCELVIGVVVEDD